MSKKSRRTSRHRKVRRNRFVLVNRGVLRRLVRNTTAGSINVMEKVVVPAVGATGGMLLSQWVAQRIAPSLLPSQDPKVLSVLASIATAYGAYIVGDSIGIGPDTQLSVAAGAGAAALVPWIPPPLMPLLPTVSAAPVVTPTVATSGYYQREMLGGLMVDVSHAGAPYKGMLGLGSDPADQAVIDEVIQTAEAVSTVEPRDLALPATRKKAVRKVRERMGTPGDRGWAGGTFARTLFSGAMS